MIASLQIISSRVLGYISPYPNKQPVITEKYKRLKYCSKKLLLTFSGLYSSSISFQYFHLLSISSSSSL